MLPGIEELEISKSVIIESRMEKSLLDFFIYQNKEENMYDLTNYRVGDEFEDSPNILSQIISAVLAEGGTFDLDGGSLVITSLPNRKEKPKEVVEVVTVEAPKPVEQEVVEAVEVVEEEPVKAEPAAQEVVPEPVKVEPVVKEVVPESQKEVVSEVVKPVKSVPKTPGRPRKVVQNPPKQIS